MGSSAKKCPMIPAQGDMQPDGSLKVMSQGEPSCSLQHSPYPRLYLAKVFLLKRAQSGGEFLLVALVP